MQFLGNNLKVAGDNVIAFCGTEGSGKSTLMGHVHDALRKPRHLSWSDSIILDYPDFIGRYDPTEKGQILPVDEGGNLFLNRDHATKESKASMKLMMMARIMQATTLIAAPRFDSLDLYLREFRVRERFLCPRRFTMNGQQRGYAVAQWLATNEDESRRWWEPVYTVRYGPYPDREEWARYEQIKEAKIASMGLDLLTQMVKK
jgi:ABC-type dipeptide/oligopeptide/nickel transport system ATPase component